MATVCLRNFIIQNTRLFTFKFKNDTINETSKFYLSSQFHCNLNKKYKNNNNNRQFSLNSITYGSGGRAETTSTIQGLSKLQAQELVLRLTSEERNILFSALQEYQSKLVKDEYEGNNFTKITFNFHLHMFTQLHK